MSVENTGHQFALYVPSLPENSKEWGAQITLKDADLAHRITRVLRLHPEESLILFNKQAHVTVTFIAEKKGEIIFHVIAYNLHKSLRPSLRVLLPILKKEAFEAALSQLTVLGVNQIQLYTSTKTYQLPSSLLQSDRLQRIMIAAAEQSKQFVLPLVERAIPLSAALEQTKDLLIYADPQGMPMPNVFEKISGHNAASLTLMVGPEGDLTSAEKQLISSHNALFCRLTPTILRAEEAVALLVGATRSFF